MDDRRHAELLCIVDRMAGNVAISGYPYQLYDGVLESWRRVAIPVRCHAYFRRQRAGRTEVLWMSY
jgi:hypothetical protein